MERVLVVRFIEIEGYFVFTIGNVIKEIVKIRLKDKKLLGLSIV